MSCFLDCLARKVARALFACLVVLIVSACTTTEPKVVERGEKKSRYDQKHDSGPKRPVNVDHISDPIPRDEPRTAAGNKSPYTVLGKTYHVIRSPEGYKKRGIASWYGNKFHGKATSNGELYNMYGMTAAHKTLPIPSYVSVTNVANKKSVIVRVNDRGPFHGNRIIDLSYSAAKKLGLQASGTGEVLVEYIDPKTHSGSTSERPTENSSSKNGPKAPSPKNSAGYDIPDKTFLQVGAFGEKSGALELKARLLPHTQYPVFVLRPKDGQRKLYRVQIGPLKNNLDLMFLKQKLIKNSFPDPHVVYH